MGPALELLLPPPSGMAGAGHVGTPAGSKGRDLSLLLVGVMPHRPGRPLQGQSALKPASPPTLPLGLGLHAPAKEAGIYPPSRTGFLPV